MIPAHGGQRQSWCSRTGGAYLVVGRQKSREGVTIKFKTKVYFSWEDVWQAGAWSAGNVLLADLSGGYASIHLIMACSAELFQYACSLWFIEPRIPQHSCTFRVRMQRVVCRLLLRNLKFLNAILVVNSLIKLPFSAQETILLDLFTYVSFHFAKILSLTELSYMLPDGE